VLPCGNLQYSGILQGEVLQRWILCTCEIHILMGIRNSNKHFWRRCRGSNWLMISLNGLIKIIVLSLLSLAGLPLLSCLCDICRAVYDRFRSTIQLQPESRKNWANCSTQSCPTLEKAFFGPRFDNTSFITHGSKDTPSILSPVQQPYPY
jgi:hypothetical protein